MASAKQVVERLFERARARDINGMAALMAEDVVVHAPGRTSVGGDHKGRDGFFAFFSRLQELSNGTLMPEVHAVLGEGEHAVALVQVMAEREGRTAGWNQVNVYHVHDGLISEVWITPADTNRWDEFWG
jgi:ketosteroid isomerase-like protein